jgi:hypoxanthine-DNA glycosylase
MCKVPKSIGFAAIARSDARVLILGTLPGAKSLECGRYYANPRNKFWHIIEELSGTPHDSLYEDQLLRLQEIGIAIWDVCHSAHRSGSLDSKLMASEPNDFDSFLSSHPGIELICFNGGKAQTLYNRCVLPGLTLNPAKIRYELLPSTSPAHAAMLYEQKLSRWRSALGPLLNSHPVQGSASPALPVRDTINSRDQASWTHGN